LGNRDLWFPLGPRLPRRVETKEPAQESYAGKISPWDRLRLPTNWERRHKGSGALWGRLPTARDGGIRHRESLRPKGLGIQGHYFPFPLKISQISWGKRISGRERFFWQFFSTVGLEIPPGNFQEAIRGIYTGG